MKSKLVFLIFLITLLGNLQTVEAQFLKKIGKKVEKAAERAVQRKSERKTEKEVGKAFDSIFEKGGKKKRKKKRKSKKSKNGNVIGGNNGVDEVSRENNDNRIINDGVRNRVARTNKDFVQGNKVIFLDQFSNDAIGDFPVTWNTNSSGEVITFDNDNTRWLQLTNKGQYTPDGITTIPENSTFEFDLYVSSNYNFYSSGFWINFVEVKDRRKDFTNWQRFRHGDNGVRLWFHPVDAEMDRGRLGIYTYVNKSLIVENDKQSEEFTKNKNLVHVSIWRQKSRIRVYIDNKKVWDIPRAFDNANYNSMVFGVEDVKDNAYFYIANLRLAVAGEDKRHALLETGKFETNEILFDVNKASIKSSSFSILNEIGQLLKENQNLQLKIIGHTDSDGQDSKNLILSQERAKSVKEYLSSHFSIARNRLRTDGKGESQPIDTNTTAKGKANNRRVEFIKL